MLGKVAHKFQEVRKLYKVYRKFQEEARRFKEVDHKNLKEKLKKARRKKEKEKG